MGLKLGKSAILGKGLKLDVNKKSISFTSSTKGFHIKINPKGIHSNAKIPGTDLTYSQEFSFKGKTKKPKPRLEVIEKTTAIEFFNVELSKELRSSFYTLQAGLGVLGIVFIFASFKMPLLFFVGALCIILKTLWRKHTDPAIAQFKNAQKLYRSKKFSQCIEALDIALGSPHMNRNLLLVKADCYLNLDKPNKAYEAFSQYFKGQNVRELRSKLYWSPLLNTILLAIDQGDYDFAIDLAEDLEVFKPEVDDVNLWKGYLKGLSFMGKTQYEIAIEAFKDAVGKKRSMEEPYIDVHYQMGIAYLYLGKKSLAKDRLQRVYSANSRYKKINEIMQAIHSGESIEKIVEVTE